MGKLKNASLEGPISYHNIITVRYKYTPKQAYYLLLFVVLLNLTNLFIAKVFKNKETDYKLHVT